MRRYAYSHGYGARSWRAGRVSCCGTAAPCSLFWLAVSSPAASRARSSRRSSRTPSRCRAPSPSGCGRCCGRAFGDRSDGSFTLVFELARTRATAGAARAGCDGGRRAARRAAVPTAARRSASRALPAPCRLRRRRLDAQPRAGEGLHRRCSGCVGRPPGVAARLRHRRAPRSSTTSTRSSTRPAARRVDRAADRAARPARRVRALRGGDDPAHLRRLHDHGRRSGSSTASRSSWSTPTYATNLVAADRARDRGRLLAADRLPVPRGARARARDATTRSCGRCRPPGRAVVFSGVAVALGLALLIAMPLPFMRMLGVAGFLIPIVSIARRADAAAGAALALRPPRRRAPARAAGPPGRRGRGFWARLAALDHGAAARSTSPPAARVLVAAAVPAFWLQLTPGSTFGIPRAPQSSTASTCCATRSAPERSRRARSSSTRRGRGRVRPRRRRGRAARRGAAARPRGRAHVYTGRASVRRPAGYEQVLVAGRHDYGFPQTQASSSGCATRLDPGGALPGAASTCWSAAGRRRASTSSTGPTPTSCR